MGGVVAIGFVVGKVSTTVVACVSAGVVPVVGNFELLGLVPISVCVDG